MVKTSPRTVQFTPLSGFIGSAQFQYTVSDPFNQTSTATVIVTVIAPLGSGPVARDDSVSVFAGDTATIAPLANDSHPDGIAFGLAGLPVVREGQATLGPNNTIQYTPPLTGGGPFVLTYTIKDEFGRTATASITVTVVLRPPVNRPPAAKDDLAGTTYNTPITIDVLANDTDPDGADHHARQHHAAGRRYGPGEHRRLRRPIRATGELRRARLVQVHDLRHGRCEVHRHGAHPGRARG